MRELGFLSGNSALQRLRGEFYRLGRESFGGYALDEDNLQRRLIVELFIDGQPYRIARADTYANELAIENLGDGCYGFTFTIPEEVLEESSTVELRVANSDLAIGAPITLDRDPPDTAKQNLGGELRWLGGLRFEGWCISNGADIPTVAAIVAGECVAEAKATTWTSVGRLNTVRLARRFDLHLPERFADGRVKRVKFIRENGEPFPGSPLSIVAFPDGLKRAIDGFSELASERPRGEQFDRLLPMAMPFTSYAEWKRHFPVAAPSMIQTTPVAIALVGPMDPEPSMTSLEKGEFPEWIGAALPKTEGQSGFDPEDLRHFLIGDAEKSEFVVFALSGTSFAAGALHRILAAFREFPNAVAVYSDFDIVAKNGSEWPIALSAFDYERMLEQGYCAHLVALRRETVLAAIEAGASSLYRLVTFLFDRHIDQTDRIVHLPGALAALPELDAASDCKLLLQATRDHLRARGLSAKLNETSHHLFPAVHVLRPIPKGRTTIIIPVRNRAGLLQTCLRSIQSVTKQSVDILIVDNDSTEPEMITYLKELRGYGVDVFKVPGAFNFPRLNNLAVQRAKGDFLCLMNNDVKAMDDGWLPEMLSRIGEPDVGAVGALLLWPSGVVQHGGTVLGPSFAAAHAFCERIQSDPGYAELLCVAHECSAVTAACLLTRRQDYLDVGGMDELHFPVNFNDVDYCLKLRARGKRIVLTPHARLYHFESASRGQDKIPDRAARFTRELQNLRARWGDALIDDPFYNPTLSLDAVPFSALAWPPRPCDARMSSARQAADIPPGF